MTFSIHHVRVVISNQITYTQSSTHTPRFSVVALLLQFIPTASCNGIPPSTGDNHQSTGERSERTQGQAKIASWISFSYICTRALYSCRSFAHWRAASTVIILLPKATFTPSILPNLGIPRTRPLLTSAINTLLAIRYSSILFTYCIYI